MSRLSRDLIEIWSKLGLDSVEIESIFGRYWVEIRSRNVEIESRFGRDSVEKCHD